LDQKNIPFDVVMTKIDKATQKSLSLHMRLLKQHLEKIVTHMPKIFTVSNVTKRGREQLLEYIEELTQEVI
jgi:GTP-binding protein